MACMSAAKSTHPMTNYDCSDEMAVSMSKINEDALLNAMKSRRSIMSIQSS